MDKGLSFLLFIWTCLLVITLPLQANSEKDSINYGSTKVDLEESQQMHKQGAEQNGRLSDFNYQQKVEQNQLERNSNQEGKLERFNHQLIEKESIPQEEEVLEFVKSAFSAQVSLSEKPRSMEDIDAILDPYFSNAFKNLFIEENIVEEKGKYLAYGSDFAKYYIPFYTYSEETKVIYYEDVIYVVEYFSASTEGPVEYNGHYEGTELVFENGRWKIKAIWYDHLPKEVIEKASE